MITIEKYFEERLKNIIAQSENNEIYFFKGFSKKQISCLIQHPNSILNSNDVIDELGNIDIATLNDKWLDIIQNIKLSDKPLVGFYEELIAIKDLLPRIRDKKIIIVDNNMFLSWQPCNIDTSKDLELLHFFQEEHVPANDELNTLSKYYGDVRVLSTDTYMLLPISMEDEEISVIPFWEECDIPVEYENSDCAMEIFVRSDEDLLYRCSLLEGNTSSILYVCKKEKNIISGMCYALSILEIPYRIRYAENKIGRKDYDFQRFIPILKQHWGSSADFRELLFYKDPDKSYETEEVSQGQIVAEIVEQCEAAYNEQKFSNIFITAPTGAGKSLLFQLPAIYMAEEYEAVTIVVSPLIALMNDQVVQLQQERNVSIAACINSSMSVDERIAVMDKVQSGEISLLYLAPELLLTTHLETFLGGRKISLLVIDEAHTVTGWGRDFRSDYWFLGDFLKKLKQENMHFPVLCLTATAVYSGEDDVVNDTIQELNLENTIIHIGNVKRNNISFDIEKHSISECNKRVEDEKIDMLFEKLKKYVANDEKSLVYFPYRSQVEQAYAVVTENNMHRISRYHGQLYSQERKIIEKNYRSGNITALLCTKAFGMGVDVSDIHHIIHFAPTGTLADYVQEIGRAARNPNIRGYAHIDYFPSDVRYVRSLNGISEMRQYQLKEMLKKINSIYQKKKHRNLLISSETFSYLFSEDDVENRTKTGLLLLAKDLQNKYSFPVLIVRPKAMLSQNYVCVPYDIEHVFLQKYGKYATKQSGQNRRIVSSTYRGKETETHIYSMGDTYLVNMAEIWENHFKEYTFGMFKKIFFEQNYTTNGKSYTVAPRIRIEIKYKESFEDIVTKTESILQNMIKILSEFKNSESKQFTAQMLENRLNEIMGEKLISHDKFGLFLDIFTETVNENAKFTKQRSQLRVLRQRKQANYDETVYFVSNVAYTRMGNYFKKMISQCKPNVDNDVFCRFYPFTKDKPIELMPLLRMLELLNYATYEIRGGEKSEVFIRINDPSKIQRLANGNYKNGVLQAIHTRHKRNEKLLNAFFVSEMNDEQRWQVIEDYFLGNEEAVCEALRLTDEM